MVDTSNREKLQGDNVGSVPIFIVFCPGATRYCPVMYHSDTAKLQSERDLGCRGVDITLLHQALFYDPRVRLTRHQFGVFSSRETRPRVARTLYDRCRFFCVEVSNELGLTDRKNRYESNTEVLFIRITFLNSKLLFVIKDLTIQFPGCILYTINSRCSHRKHKTATRYSRCVCT